VADLTIFLRGQKKQWYGTERNTAALVKAVVSSLSLVGLSGDDLWSLVRLTWITVSHKRAFPGHWKKLKAPALAGLWRKQLQILDSLQATIEALELPQLVAELAVRDTGFVNFRNSRRNAARKWFGVNRKAVQGIIEWAVSLGPDDEERLALAEKIEKLPGIPTPTRRGGEGSPILLLTPLVACLDPRGRFPIVNGRESIRQLLKGLNLADRNCADQVKGLLNLIGQFGISDAFMIDVLADLIRPNELELPKALPTTGDEGTELRDYDDDERQAVRKSMTITYRRLHNKMTQALKRMLKGCKLTQGKGRKCRYDVLVENYDCAGRDLLIEAKPQPDRGSLRIAIGQLLDYRRFLPRRAGTDLAVVTISRPAKEYSDLLLDLQISPIWFTHENCSALAGEGKSWKELQARLKP
jgi:hypothetical protein